MVTKKKYVTDASLRVHRSEADKLISDQIAKGVTLSKISVITILTSASEGWTEKCLKWDAYNEELLRRIFDSVAASEEYASSSDSDIHHGDQIEKTEAILKAKIFCLESIKERLSIFDIAKQSLPATKQPQAIEVGTRVFVVHGRDEATKQEAARFLEKLNLDPVILHEQANMGRTIIEKFEAHSSVTFAVVLLTADDLGRLASKNLMLSRRARQNVVFELGYFIGKLGRKRGALYTSKM